MPLSAQELGRLRRIINIAGKMIAASPPVKRGRPAMAKSSSVGKRIRRSGKELSQFRKMLKTERARGVPVAQLAAKHKISSAYVYSL